MVAVDLGDGPQVRTVETSGPQTLSLNPRVTDTVTISLLDWKDVIDRTALGFDQLKPPGLADIAVLDTGGAPIAAADAARNRRVTSPSTANTVRSWPSPADSCTPKCRRVWVRCWDGAPVSARALWTASRSSFRPASRSWW